MKKEIFVIFVLLFFVFPSLKSLTLEGGFTSHDMTHHIVRQIDMHRILSEGQFPPRWSGELAYGYGYPVFLFNYPLPAMIGELFHLGGLNFLYSVKAVLFLSLVLSVIGMYLFLNALFNSQLSAFLGALFYIYSPIHLIVIYVSGAVGASMGLAFPPFIFWAIVKLWQGDKKFSLVGSLSLAGLILSHNITAFLFMPLIFVFTGILFILKIDKSFLKKFILMFLFGLALSSFFWLPALYEKQFIRYDDLMKGVFSDQFPSIRQIIYSPWGYGLSHPKQPEGGMSYQIGLIHILVMLVLVPSLWFLRRKKKFLFIGGFSLIVFIISVFFMLEISIPFWKILPFFPYIQFPVRILVIPVFVSSIVAAVLVKYLRLGKILFLILLFLLFYANRNHLGINQRYDPGEDYYLSLKTSTTSFDEDLPIWVSKMRNNTDYSKFTFLSGSGKINVLENKSATVLAEFESSQSAKLRFNQYYFPGWEVKVDGNTVGFEYLSKGEEGLPMFEIAQGKHKILAEFKNTPIRNLADLISLASLIIFVLYIFKATKNESSKPDGSSKEKGFTQT